MSKLKFKYADLEIEYEGDDGFIKDQLEGVLTKFAALCAEHFGPVNPRNLREKGQKGFTPALGEEVGTTRTIAAKLAVKSGLELVVAAAAYLSFHDKKLQFSRQELLDAMRKATGYFKQSYVKNLSKYLKSAVDNQKLVEVSGEVYALHQTALNEIGAQLAN